MRILFLMPAAPLVENVSGAASRYVQHVRILAALGHEVHLVRIDQARRFAGLGDDSYDIPALISAFPYRNDPRQHRVMKALITVFDPILAAYPGARAAADIIESQIEKLSPDLIWVEHTELAVALTLLNPPIRWVYSQHDIQARVRAIRLRGGAHPLTLWDRLALHTLRRAETRIFRAAPVIVTGSATDAERMRHMGAGDVRTIPMSYDLPAPNEQPPDTSTRVIHLGSLETTANRDGLAAYLRKAHPHLLDTTLTVIGRTESLKPPLRDLLHDDPRIELLGYVSDLADVLRPGGVCILPYEQDTGYRTKLPLLMVHEQVIVSTRAALAGTQIDGIERACIIVERVDDFPDAIRRVMGNPAERMRLGEAAAAFFIRHFTHDAVMAQYRALLEREDVTIKIDAKAQRRKEKIKDHFTQR